MASDMSALTDQWMLNPTMFDPTQASNQFSNYNNAALPWPPTYNTGAGGPVSAATGQPIQSFQQWQAANPGGTTLNATPAQPQAPAQPAGVNPVYSALGQQAAAELAAQNQSGLRGGQMVPGTAGAGQMLDAVLQAQGGWANPQQQTAPGAGAASGAQASGAPNNWQAAINALSNPGTPAIGGATVPLAQGFQPSGGVNQAFLNQAGAGQGMNQNFLGALGAIQRRPQ